MVNFNGTITEEAKVNISIHNRGLNYGDAVFETLRVSAGKIYFWEDHYFRLMASMRILRMEIPMNFTMEFLEEQIIETIKASETVDKSFRVKLLVWRENGGKYTPDSSQIEYAITFEKLEAPFYTLAENDYELELFKDYYVAPGLLSTLKTNNRLINILGSIFAKENEYQNCLLLNENKQVIEALNGNIFLIKDNQIKTPPLKDGCLNGILRKQLIAIIKTMPDYTIEETSISPFELQKADELFITNVISGIIPVKKYRKKEFETSVAKQILPKLNIKARMG